MERMRMRMRLLINFLPYDFEFLELCEFRLSFVQCLLDCLCVFVFSICRAKRFDDAVSFSSKTGPQWMSIHVLLILQGLLIGTVASLINLVVYGMKLGISICSNS